MASSGITEIISLAAGTLIENMEIIFKVQHAL
jgi:hypothetical protein